MREDESADGGSGTRNSADDFSDKHLQKLRDEAIRRPVEEARKRQREIEIWKETTKGDRSNPERYREVWDSDEPPDPKLGNHEHLEDLSASETRELIDAVSSENGHMSGNHAPKRDPAPNAFHGPRSNGGKVPALAPLIAPM